MAKLTYPASFHQYSGPGTKNMSNEEISQWVKQIKKLLKRQERENPDDFSPFMCGTGNTIVFGFRTMEGERSIYVAKNYYEATYIPGEGWPDGDA